MSFLSRINIGFDASREHHNLGCDVTSTTEIGYFQPTYCRMIVPNSSVRVSNRHVVRLSPVAVPTMGRISLRNYFYYVDISTLWTPFDALRTGTNYRYGDGTVAIPAATPTFRLVDFLKDVMKLDSGLTRSQFIREFRESIVCSVYKNNVLESSAGTALSDVLATNPQNLPWTPYMVRQKTAQIQMKSSENATSVNYHTVITDKKYLDALPIVTNQNADFAWTAYGQGSTYHILGKFTGLSKRLRKIFIGCGYSFNPFDTSRQTFLKLFAVYKSWYDTMAINRTINFNNTNCYQLIKYLSENKPLTYSIDSSTGKQYCNVYDSTYFASSLDEVVTTFLSELGDICYNLPPDYFSSSDITTMRGADGYGGNVHLNSFNQLSGGLSKTDLASSSSQQSTTIGSANYINTLGQESPTAMNLAQALLKYVNKRSVVGRKIQDLLKLNGETDLHNNEHETVHHLGEDKTQIDINPIFSNSSTSGAALGDYAAVGYGQGQTDTFVYDSKSYGILLCLSCIVPVSGYFQGILHENGDSNRFDFFDGAFDALGYQAIATNELISDLQFQTASGANQIGTDLGFFGLTPRYQHLKLGRNIVNGDISIPSLQSVMLPYTFDRHFLTCVPVGNADDFGDVGVPVNSPESFRQIKANDSYGDYNRIFQYMASDFDHFILHFIFDVDVMSPMKSASNSYDTFASDDNKVLEFAHQ